VTLSNNTATNVQDFAAYDGQELTGFVYIDATSDYRAIVQVSVLKIGAGTYEVAVEDVSGDLFSGSPIVSFSMSGSILQATLPNITGYVTAYIQYNLNAPQLGGAFPLTIDSSVVAFNILTASSGSGFTFKENGGTTIVTFADSGAVALGPSSFLGNSAYHTMNGNGIQTANPQPTFNDNSWVIGNKNNSFFQTKTTQGLRLITGGYNDAAFRNSSVNTAMTVLALDPPTADSDIVFEFRKYWNGNYTIPAADTAMATKVTLGSVNGAGAWTFGSSAGTGASGHLMYGSANSGVYSLDLWAGRLSLNIGADDGTVTRTDATTKAARIMSPHYTNAQLPALGFMLQNSAANNSIFIGGGTGLANAATAISFYTAANTTTTTGTNVGSVNSSGAWTFGPQQALNYNGPKITINGSAIVAGTPTNPTSDQSGALEINTNLYRAGAGNRYETTLTGCGMAFLPRTTDGLDAIVFYANRDNDGLTASVTTIASSTSQGAWTFGPTDGSVNAHTFYGGRLRIISPVAGQNCQIKMYAIGDAPSNDATNFFNTAINTADDTGNAAPVLTFNIYKATDSNDTGAAAISSRDLLAIRNNGTTVAKIAANGDMTISSGNLIMGTSGKGIDFSATGDGTGSMTSELFNDYEEGTFTPSLTFGGLSTGITYADRNGSYTKMGRIVIARVWIFLSNKGSATGSANVTGFPYTSRNATNTYFSGMVGLVSSLPTLDKVFMNPNQTQISMQKTDASQSLADTDFTNSSYFVLTIVYEV
jgi:hypothetical protein